MLEKRAQRQEAELHIAVLPWLAFGHIIPYLHLSKSLVQGGQRRQIKVSFLSTPGNLARLPPIPPHLSSLQLVPLPMPITVYGLPADAEATTDVTPEETDLLRLAADKLAGPLTSFLDAAAPDLIIYDFFYHWLPRLARSRGVRTIFLSIYPATTLVLCGPSSPTADFPTWPVSPADLTSPAPWVNFPTRVTLQLHEAEYLFQHFLPNSTGISDIARIRAAIAGAEAVLIRSCPELEPEFLRVLSELHKKPILPIGLLFPSDSSTTSATGTTDPAVEWLDKQPAGSTAYVAFGSESVLGPEQMTELAMGLEMSGVPFIWALRDKHARLPAGFEERVIGRGLVCRGWVPQLVILAHEAVGGSLTHCGFSSFVESVGRGKPLIGLPISIDQGLHSRAIVERGLGVEVRRDEVSGSFTREDVSRAVRMVIVEDVGGPIRARALEMKDVFSSEDWNQAYVDKLVNFLENPGENVQP